MKHHLSSEFQSKIKFGQLLIEFERMLYVVYYFKPDILDGMKILQILTILTHFYFSSHSTGFVNFTLAFSWHITPFLERQFPSFHCFGIAQGCGLPDFVARGVTKIAQFSPSLFLCFELEGDTEFQFVKVASSVGSEFQTHSPSLAVSLSPIHALGNFCFTASS